MHYTFCDFICSVLMYWLFNCMSKFRFLSISRTLLRSPYPISFQNGHIIIHEFKGTLKTCFSQKWHIIILYYVKNNFGYKLSIYVHAESRHCSRPLFAYNKLYCNFHSLNFMFSLLWSSFYTFLSFTCVFNTCFNLRVILF